jgi:hypothetical protein
MANLDDEKYRLLIDSLVANYARRFGGPPENEKELDLYTESMFAHYVNTSDKFTDFVNRIPVDLSNIQIIDKGGRSLFIDIRRNKPRSSGPSASEGKRTIRYNGIIEPRQISETNRYAFYLLLRHDFKESAKRQSPPSPAVRPPSNTVKKNPGPPAAGGSLEKDFKALAVKGQAADVLAAFRTITKGLPEKDKADLSASLKSRGIYTSGDLQGLLNRWKDEARDLQKPARKRPPAGNYERSAGL